METPKEERLAELRKSVSQMTDDELYEHIGASRNNRQKPSPKKSRKKKSSKKGSSKKKTKSLDDKLDDLTPEQAAALLKKLQG